MDQEQPSGERPEGWSSSIRHRSTAAAPKLPTPYHLMLQREKLLTSGFQSPLALTERRGTGVVREAWTDIGDVGAGRRSDLRRDETFSQMSTTLGWTPPGVVTTQRYQPASAPSPARGRRTGGVPRGSVARARWRGRTSVAHRRVRLHSRMWRLCSRVGGRVVAGVSLSECDGRDVAVRGRCA